MNPDDFIVFSGSIVARGPAGARSAVSRAYYGAFHLAMDFLELMQCPCPRNGKSHDLVPKCFRSLSSKNARDAGALLHDLYSAGIKADYKLRLPEVEQTSYAMLNVAIAARVQSLLASLKTECIQDSEVAAELRKNVATVLANYGR